MISSVYELDVYQRAYHAALEIHKKTQDFPEREQASLAARLRDISKSVCARLVKGAAAPRDIPHDESQIQIMRALGYAEEMQVWLDFARDLDFFAGADYKKWKSEYRTICRDLSALAKSLSQENLLPEELS